MTDLAGDRVTKGLPGIRRSGPKELVPRDGICDRYSTIETGPSVHRDATRRDKGAEPRSNPRVKLGPQGPNHREISGQTPKSTSGQPLSKSSSLLDPRRMASEKHSKPRWLQHTRNAYVNHCKHRMTQRVQSVTLVCEMRNRARHPFDTRRSGESTSALTAGSTGFSVPIDRLAVPPGRARGPIAVGDIAEAPGDLGGRIGAPVSPGARHLRTGERLRDAVGGRRRIVG